MSDTAETPADAASAASAVVTETKSSETTSLTALSAAKTKDPDAVKLFVGQLPKTMTETDLLAFMEEFGPVFEVHVMSDKSTGLSRGCAFVTFCKRSCADKCIAELHEKRTLPGATHPIQVKIADSEIREAEQKKLFVGMLPRHFQEEDIRQTFSPFGPIEDVFLMRTAEGQSRGCGFITFTSRGCAVAAIAALHGARLDGSTANLTVKFAETEKEKQAKRLIASQTAAFPYAPAPAQVGIGHHMPMTNPHMMHHTHAAAQPPYPASFSPSPMTGLPPHHLNPYGAPSPMYGVHPTSVPDNTFMSSVAAVPPHQRVVPSSFPSQSQFPPAAGNSVQTQGPDGANLFIYHLPMEWLDADLFAAFAPFGNILSAKVFIDKTTNQSKCFGFVSYDNATSASNAIQTMNGYQVGVKRLKVQLKRPKDASRPY